MSLVSRLAGVVERLRAYAHHRDPSTAAVNVIALVVGCNGPFYPLYIVAMFGAAGLPSFLTCVSSPCFLAIPWLARRYPVAGRAALPVIGTLHTVWCTKVLGVGSGVELFFLPCIMIAALLFWPQRKWPAFFLMGLSIVPMLAPGSFYGASILKLAAEDAARLASLNLISVALLIGFIALQFAGALSRVERSD